MFEGRHNMVLYAFVTALLYLGVWWETEVTLWIAVALFFVWDVGYARNSRSFAGRDIDNLLSQVNTARLHMSYFLPFYGVLLGILFTLDVAEQQRFYALLAKADLTMGLLMLPLVIASLGILFIPIRLVRGGAVDESRGSVGRPEGPSSGRRRSSSRHRSSSSCTSSSASCRSRSCRPSCSRADGSPRRWGVVCRRVHRRPQGRERRRAANRSTNETRPAT